tara:strand:- start:340 stop:714 length:375 start_codon:yes stop_codon:yes gene_type:complete
MKASTVDDVQCKFTTSGRVDQVPCMFGAQAVDLFDTAWRQDMDSEALPMPVNPLQDEFDETTFHQFSDRSGNVLALNSNAFCHPRLRLLYGLQTPSTWVNVTEMKHDAFQHRERLRIVSHEVDS